MEKKSLEAARKLIDVVNTKENYDKVLENVLDLQIQMIPEIEPHKDDMGEFISNHLSLEFLKNESTAIYAEFFTPYELAAILQFHNTPVGKKYNLILPEILKKLNAVAVMKLQSAIDEHGEALFEKMVASEEKPEPITC